ncbi:MAG TPA: septum formation initiator family protein [Thermodesulfobacteriota bacterium]|nr:septum formation initiator family protein [Thermodesulfobacteriota bacterium]
MRFFGAIQKKYILYLSIFASGMLLFAVFGSRGLVQIYKLKEEKNRIAAANGRLQEENRRLSHQVARLRNSREEIEKVARDELGLVRKDELVYHFEK